MSFVSTDSASAETTTWLTPLPIVRSLGRFDLDPCAFPGHDTASRLICLPECGLSAEWAGRVWLNPPYGKEAKVWLEKLQSHEDGFIVQSVTNSECVDLLDDIDTLESKCARQAELLERAKELVELYSPIGCEFNVGFKWLSDLSKFTERE